MRKTVSGRREIRSAKAFVVRGSGEHGQGPTGSFPRAHLPRKAMGILRLLLFLRATEFEPWRDEAGVDPSALLDPSRRVY